MLDGRIGGCWVQRSAAAAAAAELVAGVLGLVGRTRASWTWMVAAAAAVQVAAAARVLGTEAAVGQQRSLAAAVLTVGLDVAVLSRAPSKFAGNPNLGSVGI